MATKESSYIRIRVDKEFAKEIKKLAIEKNSKIIPLTRDLAMEIKNKKNRGSLFDFKI